MAIQYVILVAGYDYYGKGKVSFEKLCLNRMNRILKKQKPGKDSDLRFVLFDFKTGTLKLNFVSHKKRRIWTVLKKFKPVTSANYEGNEFLRNQSGVMSITDVYEYILELGRDEPGTVIELSFLSHGYPRGPILVNSLDADPDGEKRDPQDKDARWKDFNSVNLDIDEMKLAFDPDATVWNWGCNVREIYRQVLHQIIESNKYKQTPRGRLRDDDKIPFHFTRKWAVEYYKWDYSFFPDPDPDYKLRFERSLDEIKEFLKGGLEDTYSYKIAKAMGVKCYGALLGMYSTYEDSSIPLPLMLIPQSSPPYSDNFTRQIRFFTTYMAIKIDPENRGYGRFDP